MATGSAEAELYAGNQSMGVQAFANDLGRAVAIWLHIDSTVALSIISRTGIGKAEHIEIQHLWLEEAVRNNRLKVEKIPSKTTSSSAGQYNTRWLLDAHHQVWCCDGRRTPAACESLLGSATRRL